MCVCSRVLPHAAIVDEVPCKGGRGRESVSPLMVPLSFGIFWVLSPEGSLTCVVASSHRFLTVSMASVGKPRLYVIQSILSWSVVLKADVKSTIRALMSFLVLCILKAHDDILKLVYGVFLVVEACLLGAEQGACLSVFVEGVGDKACPQLVQGVG